MKITKKMRKKAMGMNAITSMNLKRGFRSVNGQGAIIPPFSKIGAGTPYVNPDNFL